MKKIVLFAAIAIGAIACSKTDLTETLNDQNEIRFSKAQMGNTIITRANETLVGSESFGVYAYLSSPAKEWFTAENLSSKDNGTTWGLANKYYYPTGDFSMDFWAYGKDYAKNKPSSVSATGLVYTNYTIDQTKAADHEAFVILKDKKTITQTEKNTPIALHFWHALSKIQFTAKINTVTGFENVDAKITSITINTNKQGSLDYQGATSKWNIVGNKTDEKITLTNTNVLGVDATAVTGSFYLIPFVNDLQTNTVTVEATLCHKGTDIQISNPIKGTFDVTGAQAKINNSITYNIILDLDKATGLAEIKFDKPTIEDWIAATGESMVPKN